MNNRKHGINFSEDQVIIFLYQILMGLKKMKAEHGIKHRDLKPQNILLLDQFTYLLTDFTTCKVNLVPGEDSILIQKKDPD
jgi:serine/threonine protein kinase